LSSASKLLLEALGQKEAPLIAEEEAAPQRLRGHDVLFLRMRNQKAFSLSLPKELSAPVNRFSVLDETYDSYLVFRNGVNQAKGTWPVPVSPLIHDFIAEEVIP